jgi:hypothetical protein
MAFLRSTEGVRVDVSVARLVWDDMGFGGLGFGDGWHRPWQAKVPQASTGRMGLDGAGGYRTLVVCAAMEGIRSES